MRPSTRPGPRRRGVPAFLPTALAAVALAGACDGAILAPPGNGGSGDVPALPPPAIEGPDGVGDYGPELPADTTRFPRLTHVQWERTVVDLLGVSPDVASSAGFREDPRSAGFLFDDDAARLEVDQTLWSAYQRAAETVAAAAVADLGSLGAPADGTVEERAAALVDALGPRAYRRPLTDDEGDALLALHAAGTTMYPGVGAFEAGARLVIEALLQSPLFLYRVEDSDTVEDGLVPLSQWEVATRLSYALWDSMPDEALFARARAGELDDLEVVASEARRMLDDPRAADTVARFHAQLLDVGRYATIGPSRDVYPEAPRNLGALATQESDLFLRDLFDRGLGLNDMLTSTETFANAELAAVYGVDPSGLDDGFTRVSLNPAERRGIFTQVGFLAKNATSTEPDPIHRGVFLSERIACNAIGVPPGDIPPLPPADGRTNRERVEQHTEQEGSVCAQCHENAINPFGFPFESYDAVGGWRTEDNGFPVNTATAPLIGGETLPVADAIDLAETMAASPAVHRCYANHVLELVHARHDAAVDDALLARLADRSLAGASIRDLLVALVATPAFVYRAVTAEEDR